MIRLEEKTENRQAIEVLADAVAREVTPGMFELKLAARTLRDALDDPSPGALSRATRAFEALDPALRRRIHQQALSAAIGHFGRTRRTSSEVSTN